MGSVADCCDKIAILSQSPSSGCGCDYLPGLLCLPGGLADSVEGDERLSREDSETNDCREGTVEDERASRLGIRTRDSVESGHSTERERERRIVDRIQGRSSKSLISFQIYFLPSLAPNLYSPLWRNIIGRFAAKSQIEIQAGFLKSLLFHCPVDSVV